MSKHRLIPVTGFTQFTNTQPQRQTEERGSGGKRIYMKMCTTHISLSLLKVEWLQLEIKLTLHKYAQTSQNLRATSRYLKKPVMYQHKLQSL